MYDFMVQHILLFFLTHRHIGHIVFSFLLRGIDLLNLKNLVNLKTINYVFYVPMC
jgi:hypothetical protein